MLLSFKKEEDFVFCTYLYAYVDKEQIEFKPFWEIGSTRIIIELMKKGSGISFLPTIAVEEELRNQQISKINVSDWNVTMWSQILYHKNKYVTPQMTAFFNYYLKSEKDTVKYNGKIGSI